MKVERAKAGHVPNHLRQHAERHHDLQVCLIGCQFFQETGVFQTGRLEHGQVVCHGKLFHGGGSEHGLMTSDGFVGHGDDSHDAVASFHEGFQRSDGKIRRSHINDS